MARAGTVNAPRGSKARRVRAVGYVRRSTDRQEQSIGDQKQAIEAYAAEHELRLLRFYVDDAISGTSTVGRRAFQELVEHAQRPSCDLDLILVYDVKRFGRIDNDEAGYWRHVLRSHGVEVVYISEGFTGDGTDDLLRPVKQWQARQESKDLAKVVIRGLVSKATDGRHNGIGASGGNSAGGGWWMGGAPPFGYDLRYESQGGEFLFVLRYMRDGSKQMLDGMGKLVRTLERGESISVSRRDRCKLLRSDPERVKIVKRIYRMYVTERRGFKAIADALNRGGVPAPRGPEWAAHYSGLWSMTTVRAVLVNPAYCGDMAWNRRTDARFHRIAGGRAVERKGVVGRRLEANDEADWLVTRDAHPTIVPRRTWEAAKKRLAAKVESRSQRGINTRTGEPVCEEPPDGAWTGPRAKFLLSGLISCSRCGSRYEGYTRRATRRDENGQRIKTLHYACGGYIRHGRATCTLGAVDRDQLEDAVIAAMLDAYAPFRGSDAKARVADAIKERLGADRAAGNKQRRKYESQLRKLESTMRNLIDSLTPVNKAHVDRRLAELESQRQQLELKLQSLQQQVLSEHQADLLVREARSFARGLPATLSGEDLDERRAAVRRCVEGIEIDLERDRATVTLRTLPADLGADDDAPAIEVVVPLRRRPRGRPAGTAQTGSQAAGIAARRRGR